MYNCVSLSKKNLKSVFELNNQRNQFNMLNEDFEEYYNSITFTQQFFEHRRIKLLIYENNIVGYIWITKQDKNSFIINSMYVSGEDDLTKKYSSLLECFNYRSKFIYCCERNAINYEVLSRLGFKKKAGTYEMYADVINSGTLSNDNDIVFEQFIKGKHEETRCQIQNEVFKNDTRIPLHKDDIYYDEIQSYYFEKGSILLRLGNKYIGYGQIIFNDSIPTIVNVGVLEGYRGKGYGRALMCHLFKILNEEGVWDVKLRVEVNNESAISLYKSLGFRVQGEMHTWEYKK